jgi:conjugal transfer mating pair stabilization protein TraG
LKAAGAGYPDGRKTWNYYVRQLFGGKPNPDLLFSQMIGDSYNFFYSSGQSAGQIIRQNVTMNACAAVFRATRPAVGYGQPGEHRQHLFAGETSAWHRRQWATRHYAPAVDADGGDGIMIGLFPIMVMAAMFNMMTMQVLKGTFMR